MALYRSAELGRTVYLPSEELEAYLPPVARGSGGDRPPKSPTAVGDFQPAREGRQEAHGGAIVRPLAVSDWRTFPPFWGRVAKFIPEWGQRPGGVSRRD